MEEIKLNGGCNKDVPVEQTIHYIVKDYRRMFHEHDKLVETIAALREKLLKSENEALHREKRIAKLENKLGNIKTECGRLKSKLSRKPDGCSVNLCGRTDESCSVLFYGEGGICYEHRLSYDEIGQLYVKLGEYLQGYHNPPAL